MSGRHLTIFLLIVLSVSSRLIPHPWNLTAVGSVALFSGAYLRPRILSCWLPVLAFFLSDIILGFHETMLFNYAAVLIGALLGARYLPVNSAVPWTGVPWTRVGGLTLTTSLIFFVISNLGVWLMTPLYPRTLEGLVACFTMALPFFQGQLMGDLLYGGLLFGAFQLISKKAGWSLVPSKAA